MWCHCFSVTKFLLHKRFGRHPVIVPLNGMTSTKASERPRKNQWQHSKNPHDHSNARSHLLLLAIIMIKDWLPPARSAVVLSGSFLCRSTRPYKSSSSSSSCVLHGNLRCHRAPLPPIRQSCSSSLGSRTSWCKRKGVPRLNGFAIACW